MDTSARAIEVEATEIEIEGARMPARLYLPNRPGPHPGVLGLVSESGSMTGPQGMAEQLAARGFAVLLPQFYFRERDHVLPFEESSLAAGRIMRLVALSDSADERVKDERTLDQLSAIVEFMQRDPRVSPRGIALVGLRLGARFALMLASRKPQLISACVAAQPVYPLAALKDAAGLKAPLRLIFAEGDESVSSDVIDRVRAQLDYLGKDYTLRVVPGVDGYVMIADSPSFNPEVVRHTFNADVEWLEKVLG